LDLASKGLMSCGLTGPGAAVLVHEGRPRAGCTGM
jgi:hypothetical protein